MNTIERANMVKAMELIARSINDEEYVMWWLEEGVADGDLTPPPHTEDWDNDLGCYIEDDNFSELMGLFLKLMHKAYKDGGIYCDDVLSAN